MTSIFNTDQTARVMIKELVTSIKVILNTSYQVIKFDDIGDQAEEEL